MTDHKASPLLPADQTPTTRVVTFGCRLNHYESGVIEGHLNATQTENTFVFNTCAVTAEAERQARQSIRKIRKTHPEARIIVTGCAAQIHPERYAAMPEVNQVIGNMEKMDPKSYESQESVLVGDIMRLQETAAHLVTLEETAFLPRAFLEIQNGCNHRCTFCQIPFGRGNNRSVPLSVLAAHVKTLVQRGIREIVLTGVDITDYGQDLPGKPTLGTMIRRLLALVPELERLRLSSLDPVEMDEHLYDVIGSEPRLLPHFHLSIQAGDDLILKRMKRRHLREDVMACVSRLRALRPDAVFGADFIAGFPTETEEMFLQTIELVERLDITYLHVFPFSPHHGTPAARMPQVARRVVKERAARLRTLGSARLAAYLQSWVGQEVTILAENESQGRTDHFAPVRLLEVLTPGHVYRVRITNATEAELTGTCLQNLTTQVAA